jgi:predicted nucleotidyltransferase
MGLSQSGLGDALFAGVQQRVLGTLFGNPERSFYGNELLRLTASGKGALQRELDRLVKAGLVTVRSIGNQKHYQANPEAPIFEELRGIAVKTFGVGDVVREALRPLARKISAAFIYGSIAKRADTTRSDIDLLVVSETLGYQDLIRALQPAERRIGRKISPTLYSAAELAKKRSGKSSFVTRILEQPKIFLIGSERDLG